MAPARSELAAARSDFGSVSSIDIEFDELESPPVQKREFRPHPLAPVADAIHDRLLEIGAGDSLIGIEIVDGPRPIVTYLRGKVQLAGDDRRLRQILAVLDDATEAIDLVVAHALTLMAHSESSFTEASERHALCQLLYSG